MPHDPFDPFQNGPGMAPGTSVDEIFTKPQRGGVPRAYKPAPAAEAEPLEIAPEAAPESPEGPKKPETRLFNPKWGGKQGSFNQKMSVSVEGELAPESSHLTRVTFTIHALLPDGKLDRIGAEEGHLENGKATAEITLWAPDYRDEAGELLQECEYAFKAKHRDGKDVESEKLPARNIPDPVHRVRMSGMLFDANKCFPLPDALGGIKAIVAMHKQYPSAQVLLVGHAGSDEDLAGSDIAFERAQMLAAYLKCKPNPWLNQFGPGKHARSRWGTREVQLMLSALPEGGQPYYAGNASGVTDEATRNALKAFQEEANRKGEKLPVDGGSDFQTRQALVKAYMGLNATTLGEDVTPIAHGVEGHVEDAPTASGNAVDDRRFEAFFFEKGIEPQPGATTSEGMAGPYPEWIANVADTEDFENHGIHVQIVDADRHPVPFAEVKLKGPVSAETTSDEHGFVSFKGLAKGEYTIASEKNGYKVGVSRLTYPTAKTVPGRVKAAQAG